MTETIRALSWKQPYAQLMLHGKIETRTWGTKYRGLVLICASKVRYSLDAVCEISDGKLMARIIKVIGNPYCSRGSKMGIVGHAIAIGRLADCRPMTPEDEDKCFVRYKYGLWCHVYEEVKAIDPFPWTGKQGWSTLTEEDKSKIKFL